MIKNNKLSRESYYMRRMLRNDLASVLEIECVSFPSPWSATAFMGEIANFGISFPYVIVNKDDERIIGYIIYWKVEGEVQISNIAVHPEFRRQGVAEAVMCWMLEEVKAAGAKYVILEVRPSNSAATSLYEKLGFKVLGVRKGYYKRPPEDAVVMGKIIGS